MHESLLLPGWQFLLSETHSTGVGDIGFLLSPCAVKALPFFSFPSHHIGKIVLDFSDRRFCVFCVYAPTAVDHDRIMCRIFYDKLSPLVNDIPLLGHILICGEFNAPLTADGCRVKYVYGEPNSNLEDLQAFINIRDLVAANGMRQKRSNLPTFNGPSGRCMCLDWIFSRDHFRLCERRSRKSRQRS